MANETLKSITIKGVTFDVPSGGGGGGATYRLEKTGDSIKLTEDGTVVSTVIDANTEYSFSINDHTLTITPSSGTGQTVTIPDENTTYTLSISGTTLTLTPSTGSAQSVTLPGGETYRLSKSGSNINLTADGTTVSTVTDDDTKYTAGSNIQINASNVISATDTTYTAGSGLSLSGTQFSAKTGYTTSGNNRAVQADANGNLYVTQKDDDTTYTAGSNVQISSSNVISATDTTYSAGSGINIDSSNVISATGGGGGGASYRLTKSGSDIKLTEDGTVVSTVTDSDTTYSAGSGLSLSGTTFSVKTGYTTSGNNRKVQTDSSGNLYVVQTDTTYTAGENISISSGNVISGPGTGSYLHRLPVTSDPTRNKFQIEIPSITSSKTISLANNSATNYEVFTAQKPGRYLVYVEAQFAANATGARFLSPWSFSEGASFGGAQRTGAAPSGMTYLSGFGTKYLNTGEKLGARLFQNSGSALSTTIYVSGAFIQNGDW